MSCAYSQTAPDNHIEGKSAVCRFPLGRLIFKNYCQSVMSLLEEERSVSNGAVGNRIFKLFQVQGLTTLFGHSLLCDLYQASYLELK